MLIGYVRVPTALYHFKKKRMRLWDKRALTMYWLGSTISCADRRWLPGAVDEGYRNGV